MITSYNKLLFGLHEYAVLLRIFVGRWMFREFNVKLLDPIRLVIFRMTTVRVLIILYIV